MTVVRDWTTAAVAGLLLGSVVVSALYTAPWWAEVLDIGTHGDRLPAPGTLAPCSGDPACVDPATVPAPVLMMAGLVAGVRERAGCTSQLTFDARLGAAAQQHTEALAAGARPSHVDAAQRTPQDRADAHGYSWPVVETVASGISSAKDAVNIWLDPKVDPTIARRFTDCRSRDLGIGWSADRPGAAFGPGVWVVLYGQRPA